MATALEHALNETFEPVSSGASLTYHLKCSLLRVGGFVVIKNEPCKVMNIGTSKTGKHGGNKMHIVGLNIFTGKKHETLCMSTDDCQVPHVSRKEYQLISIDSEGFLCLYDEGTPKQDLRIGTQEIDKELQAAFDEGKDLLVTIQSAMGQEGVFSFKEERAV
jgi:translation initiation factor 5A